MPRAHWGIDISRSSIKAVRLERRRDEIFLTKVDVLAYKGGTDQQPDEDALREALSLLKKRNRMGGEAVGCTLPGHSTFNRPIRLPPVEAAQIPEIVRYEAQSQIPFPLEEVIWDYHYIDREYATGEEREVVLFAVKRDIVEAFLKSIEAVNLNIAVVQFAPVALYNFLRHEVDLAGGTIILDVGAENTDLILTDGMRYWVRNLPITGNEFTAAIQKALSVNKNQAEQLKRKAGATEKAPKLYAALQPVYSELVGEINRSLGYFKSISKGAQLKQSLLLGNGAKALNFQRYMAQSLSMPANRIQKLAKVRVDPRVDQSLLGSNLATIGTVLGIALQGFDVTVNKVNLLPPAYHRKRQLKKKEPVAIACAAALLVVASFGVYWTGKRLEEVTKARDAAKSSYDKYRDLLQDVNRAKAQFEPLENELRDLDKLYSPRDLSLKIMDYIASRIPDNAAAAEDSRRLWVLDIRFEERRRASAEPPPSGSGQGQPVEVPGDLVLEAMIEVAVLPAGREVAVRSAFIQETLFGRADDPAWIAFRPLLDGDPQISPSGERPSLLPTDILPREQPGTGTGTRPPSADDVQYSIFKVALRALVAPPAPPAEAAPDEAGG